MTEHIDTRDGWRQAAAKSPGVKEGSDVLIRVQGGARTYWVRDEPVPPLPTEPYTVIRVTWKVGAPDDDKVLTLHDDGWRSREGRRYREPRITGFEVLSVPVPDKHDRFAEQQRDAAMKERVRRETVKTILQEVREGLGRYGNVDPEDLYRVGKRYGVDL